MTIRDWEAGFIFELLYACYWQTQTLRSVYLSRMEKMEIVAPWEVPHKTCSRTYTCIFRTYYPPNLLALLMQSITVASLGLLGRSCSRRQAHTENQFWTNFNTNKQEDQHARKISNFIHHSNTLRKCKWTQCTNIHNASVRRMMQLSNNCAADVSRESRSFRQACR